jgi:hypothetical protein
MTAIVHKFIFVLVLCWAAFAHAQPAIEVSASVEPERAYLGSSFRYIVSVRCNQRLAIEEPRIDFPPGVRVLSTGSSFMSQPGRLRDANGNLVVANVVTQSFTYTLSASEFGRLTIPAAEVVVDGRTMTTNAVDVEIVEPEELDDFAFEARLSKPRAFVGEPVTLRLTWYIGRDVQSFALGGAEAPDGLLIEAINDPVAFRDRSGQYLRAEIFGQNVYGKRGEGTLRGQSMLTLTFELSIVAERPGPYTLDPFVMIFDTPRRAERGSERGISRTAPVEFVARAVPLDSRPRAYAGLIGSYTIEASATPTDVNVGDPITLRVRIAGTNAPRVADGPRLDLHPSFTDHFKLDAGGWTRVPDSTGRAVFTTTIRALSDQVTEIPSIELPFFDPLEARFHTASTPAIPISVRSTRDVTLADAILSPLRSPASRSTLDRAAPGLWAIAAPDRLAAPSPAREIEAWFWVALASAPGAALIVLAATTLQRRAAHPAAVRTRALRQACRLARRHQTEQALRHFLSACLSQSASSITAADCARMTVSREEASELASYLEQAEASRFGGGAAPPADPQRLCHLMRKAHAESRS